MVLTHYSPVLLFWTHLKYQNTTRFSDVFRGYRKATPGCNWLALTCLSNNVNIFDHNWILPMSYHRLPIRYCEISNCLFKLILLVSEMVVRRSSVNTSVFKTFPKLTFAEISFLIKLQSFSLHLYWKMTPTQIFFCWLWEISKTNFFYRYLRETVSVTLRKQCKPKSTKASCTLLIAWETSEILWRKTWKHSPLTDQ